MKLFLYAGLLLFAIPALAGPCGNVLVFGPGVPIDPPVEARLQTVGLSRDDLATMIDARKAIYDVDGPMGAVTGSVFARSPKDHVVYRIRAIVNEPFANEVTFLRIVGFERAPAFMQKDFDQLKRSEEEDWAGLTVPENIARMTASDFAKPPAPGPANENENQRVFDVTRGPFAGKRFAADELWLFIKLAPNGMEHRDLLGLLERDEVGGLELTRNLAYDLGLPYDRGLRVVVGRLGTHDFGVIYRELSTKHFEIEDLQVVAARATRHYRKR